MTVHALQVCSAITLTDGVDITLTGSGGATIRGNPPQHEVHDSGTGHVHLQGGRAAYRRCMHRSPFVLFVALAACTHLTETDTNTVADTDTDSDTEPAGPWLRTDGNHIVTASGTVWQGRGANVHDTRSCWACAWSEPDVDEVKRRIDTLVDDWGATFLRLDLESYASGDNGEVQWRGVLDDPAYLADVVEIVRHVGTKPGVYVMVSLWVDPTFSELGWPTAATRAVWTRLASTFASTPHVMFGLCNEPQHNFDGALDGEVWTAMNDAVQAIRDAEAASGAPQPHLVSVQGTGGWSRFLQHYVDHPITAGGGANVVYEVHVYDPATEFASRFETPGQTLPVIIGEFGEEDATELMNRADASKIPYLAWTFHPRCPPNLIVDHTGGGCGEGMTLEPTGWGEVLRTHLLAR